MTRREVLARDAVASGRTTRLLPWLLAAGWLMGAAVLAAGFHEIRVSDVYGFVYRATLLRPDLASLQAFPFVDPLYPWGYPAALRLAEAVTHNYHRAGQLLSLAGGVLTLLAVWRISAELFGAAAAIAATVLLAVTANFNEFALQGTTDLPALGLTYAAVAAILWTAPPERMRTFAGGVLLGLGYLMRYTALTAVPAIVIFLLMRPRNGARGRWTRLALFAAGFAIAASPQLLPTAIVHGNPFWNRQDVNVYFGLAGQFDWAAGWADAEASANGLLGIFLSQPAAFTRNWLARAAEMLTLLPWLPMTLCAAAGLVTLTGDRTTWRSAGLLVGVGATFAVLLCTAFVTNRLILPVLPPLAVFAGYGLATLTARLAAWWSMGRRAPALLMVAVLLAVAVRDVRALDAAIAPTDVTAVSTALYADGLRVESEVLSLDHNYYLLGTRQPIVFARPWLEDASFRPQSFADVVQIMRRGAYRYLVFNDRVDGTVRALADDVAAATVPHAFVEIYRDGEFPHARVWRLRAAAAQQP